MLAQLKRIEVRSPQTGIVHQLAVHTIGGVVSAGEPLMLIVPRDDRLVIDARVEPHSVDQITPGQLAHLRFTAFNQRTTPESSGTVERVSADLVYEAQTNLSYYLVRIVLPESELNRLGNLRLVPGMPAEVHIQTAERSALSYLMKLFSDQLERAFRER